MLLSSITRTRVPRRSTAARWCVRASAIVTAEAGGKSESASFAGLALQTKLTAHQLHQAQRDGEAEPGPAKLARGGGISLGEGPKQTGLLVGRHSDASVTDSEFEFDFAVIESDRLHGNDNFSLVGKLNGVGTEIHQNLLQAQGVTHEMERRLGIGAKQDFQPLLVSAHADHTREVFENFLETRTQCAPWLVFLPRFWRSRGYH